MIFPSIGYNIGGLTDLLDGLECKTILLSSKQMDIVSKLSHSQWNFHQVPSLAELLDKQYPHFPFIKTFEEARSEPLVVIHTSGTTGAPKPVIWTHDWAAAWVQRNQAVPPKGHASIDYGYHGIECCPATPPNHVSALPPLQYLKPIKLTRNSPAASGLTSSVRYKIIRWYCIRCQVLR